MGIKVFLLWKCRLIYNMLISEICKCHQMIAFCFFPPLPWQSKLVAVALLRYSSILRSDVTAEMEGNVSGGNHNFCENSCNQDKKSYLNSRKKITYVDDMMIHNFVNYSVQTRLEICYFLYLTNEVEFGHDILQDYVSSYHLHV